MTAITIRHSTIAELSVVPNRKSMLDEYARESSIAGLPNPNAQISMYEHLEASGALRFIAAFKADLLIGYVTVLASTLPHYGVLMAMTESFFVSAEHRKSGAGLRLLRAAEQHARDIQAPGLLVSAPFGGRLAEVLPHVGYAETNRVFFKKFSA